MRRQITVITVIRDPQPLEPDIVCITFTLNCTLQTVAGLQIYGWKNVYEYRQDVLLSIILSGNCLLQHSLYSICMGADQIQKVYVIHFSILHFRHFVEIYLITYIFNLIIPLCYQFVIVYALIISNNVHFIFLNVIHLWTPYNI